MDRRPFVFIFIQFASFKFLQACNNPLGMENKFIQSSQITIGDNIGHSTNLEDLRYNAKNSWCTGYRTSGSFNEKGYIQVDLKSDYKVSAILLQGGAGSNGDYSYGEKMKIQWRDNKTNFFGYYKGADGPELKLKAWKSGTEDKISFIPPLCARFLRILPYLSENSACIRFEILGCFGCSENPVTDTVTPTNGDSTLQSTSLLKTTKVSSSAPPKTLTKQNSTTDDLVTPSPSERSTESMTVVVIVIVCVLCLLVILSIVLYRFRHRIKCMHKNNNTAHKRPKKKTFAVKMEATYSEINPNDELDRLPLEFMEESKATENEDIGANVYSQVYAAPVIAKPGYSKVTANGSPFSSRVKQESRQPINYAEPCMELKNGQCNIKEPIYAGSLIYESPYQAVTVSSFYADPNVISHSGSINIPEFPRSKLRFLEQIGEGQFGEVHICEVENLAEIVEDAKRYSTALIGVTKVAVKLLKAGQDSSVREEFMKEARVMTKLEHENVVQLIGVCLDEPQCMVVEYMENGDLMQFLQAHERYTGPPNPRISLIPSNVIVNDTLFYIILQITAGMNYLSSQGFVHRDLATRNCLVGHSFTVKIADFGMSRNLYSKQYYRIEGKAVLPIRWMAPESIFYGTFTTQTDIWSFAVTVWEIFTFAAEQPFESLSDQQVIENALSLAEAPGKSSQYLSQPKGCPDGTFFMLRKCWKTVPEERPSFQELFGFFTALCPEFKDERV